MHPVDSLVLPLLPTGRLMKVRNVRKFPLEIAATGQVVEPNATAEVDDDLGARLVAQPDNWKPVRSGKTKEGES